MRPTLLSNNILKRKSLVIITLVLGILIFGFIGFSSAQLYKYYNEKGVICFTDDYSMVPAERPGTETIHEIKPLPSVPITPGSQG